MSERLEITIAGESLQLFADRALYWPREHALLIADLHLGKADVFRAAGIALPSGGTRTDLRRLSDLLNRTGAGRIIVLGDLLHGTKRHSHWHQRWNAWREEWRSVRVQVISGNHDRALQRIDLGIEAVGNMLVVPPFELRHLPRGDGGAHVICGHLHPVVRLPGVGRRWPVFVLDQTQTMLPAFSLFTGGWQLNVVERILAVCVSDTITLIGSTITGQGQIPSIITRADGAQVPNALGKRIKRK